MNVDDLALWLHHRYCGCAFALVAAWALALWVFDPNLPPLVAQFLGGATGILACYWAFTTEDDGDAWDRRTSEEVVRNIDYLLRGCGIDDEEAK